MFNLNFDNYRIILIIPLVFIVAGLIGAQLVQGTNGRTERSCPCSQNNGEIDCNKITENNFMFYTGIFNLVEVEKSTQVITCSDGEKIDTQTETNGHSIELRILYSKIISF